MYRKDLYKNRLMKKCLIACSFLIFPLFISAQSFHYGIHAGSGVTTILERTEWGGKLDKNIKFGFIAGVSAEFEIMKFLSVSSSVSFFQKGDKIMDEFAKSSISLGYIDVPVFVGLVIPLGNMKITGSVGPYTSIAVVGKKKFEMLDPESDPDFEWNFEDNSHESYTNDEVFNGETYSYKRFDTGLSVGLKLAIKNYRVAATYSRGLRDIRPNETITAQNSAFSLTLTYFIK